MAQHSTSEMCISQESASFESVPETARIITRQSSTIPSSAKTQSVDLRVGVIVAAKAIATRRHRSLGKGDTSPSLLRSFSD